MNRRRRLVILTLGGALGGASLLGVVAASRTLGGSRSVPLLRLERQTFVHQVVAEGFLRAAQATPITAPAAAQGPLKVAWLLPDGSRVQSGDVVIRFDPTEHEIQLLEGLADRAMAEARMAKARTERHSTLQNLDQDAHLAQRELEYARTFQSLDPELFSRLEILESKMDAELAKRRLEHAETVQLARDRLFEIELALLSLERRKADLKIERARQALAALEVTAPHDGIFILERDWRGETLRVGETVWAGRRLAEIPRPHPMEAEVYVLEADAGGLAVGRRATVELDARPGISWEGEVRRVDSVARPRIRGAPVQYFGVTLTLARTDPEVMKPGQRVRATLILEAVPDALVVPRQAIFQRNGRSVVYVRRSRRFEPQEVRLGQSALGRVVVEDGLRDGDLIALRDPSQRLEPAAPASGEPGMVAAAGSGGRP